MSKRYYWLKQRADFFKDAKIKKLRRIAGGDTYTIIYQKMMLLSITNGGVIPYQGIEPTFHEELALELDEDEVNVQATLVYLQSQGMMEQISEDEFLMSQVPALIGSESDSAERVRRLRAKQKNSAIESNTDHKALQCNSTVTQSKRKEKREKSIELPEWLDANAWNEWLGYRKEIKAKMTETTVKKQINFLEKHKQVHKAILSQSIQNGWRGLFELKNTNGVALETQDKFGQWK